MKQFYLLKICLHRFDIDNIKRQCKSLFTLSAIFTIVLSFSLLLMVIYYNKIHVYMNSSYDYVMRDFDEKGIQKIKDKPFVDSVFVTRIVTGEMENSREEVRSVNLMLCDSFRGSEMMYYGNIESVFKNRENGIILDVITARRLKVGINDTIRMKTGPENNVNVEFVVLKIVESDGTAVKGTAIASYNYFLDKSQSFFGDYIPASEMFVKVNNQKAEAEKFFYDEYISPRMEDSSWEEIKENNLNSNIKRIWQIEDTEKGLENTPKVTIITSILGGVMCFFFIWRDTNLKMIVMKKNYAILHVLGISTFFLKLYFHIERFILQVPAIFISCIFVKKVIYDMLLDNLFLPWKMIWAIGCLTVVISLVMSSIICLFTLRRFKRSNLSMILAKE